MKKRLLSILLAFSLAFAAAQTPIEAKAAKNEKAESLVFGEDELRGVWISIYDLAPLGLKKNTKGAFRKAFKNYVKRASDFGVNAIFLHVRANDDALWESDTFPAMSHFAGTSAATRLASDVYKFDPLEVAIDVAHDYGVELHAWINPYRVNATVYLNPGLSSSQTRVKKAVRELLEYDIDGIHMDDYFYHAEGGYVSNSNRAKAYPIYISATQKCANVNRLVKAIHTLCANNDVAFGISPQGNLDNDLASGADVPTWLSKKGYVDYVAPQIYWTDSSRTSLFSQRLAQFSSLRHNNAKLYVGLALYRAGSASSSDPGWVEKNNNIATQVKKLRKSGSEGFLIYSGQYLFSSGAYGEVKNLAPIMEK